MESWHGETPFERPTKLTAMPMLDIARELIRIPSVNPDYDARSQGEGGVAAWLETWGREAGFEVWSQPVLEGRSNVVLRLHNKADRPHLMLNGHMDTVGTEGMTIPPFQADLVGGRLLGRGSTDMKGAIACMLAAACRLRDDLSAWKGTLSVGCVVDEECAFRGVKAMMGEVKDLDFAVVGEPTSLQVIRGCKGCLRFAFRAKGLAHHSSRPEQGRSAIVAMADAILQLEDFFQGPLADYKLPEFGCSTGSVGLIEGGEGINVVAAGCRTRVDIRLIPGQDAGETYARLQDWVRTRATRVADIEWIFDEPLLQDEAFQIPADALLVRAACAIASRKNAGVVAYGCDAGKIADKGVPCIIWGPGDIAQAHTKDESIAVEELHAATDCYERLARALLPA